MLVCLVRRPPRSTRTDTLLPDTTPLRSIEEHVYSIDYRAPGEPQRLTEAGFSNTAVMNKAGSAMIVTRSSPTQPPQVYAASADGRRSGWISANRIDAKHPYAPYLAAHRDLKSAV